MFKYYLIKTLRNKMVLFWTLIFPLALMTVMKVAFGSIYDMQNSIDPMKTVIVTEGEGAYQDGFRDVVSTLSDKDSDNYYFDLTEEKDLAKAKDLLLDEKAEIVFSVKADSIEVFLSEDHSDTAAIISKSVADSFDQKYTMIKDAYMKDPSAAASIAQDISSMTASTKPVENAFDGDPDPYTWYFYSTFVMGIFFIAMMGVALVGDLKADVSAEAMRFSLSPAGKGKMIFYSYLSKLIPCLMITAIQLAYMKLVLNVPLGKDPLKLFAFTVSAIMFSLSFGVICGLFFKGTVSQRANKATAIIMTSVFLSGEMIGVLPGLFEQYCPIINDINPATVMNMTFYNLTVGNSVSGFYLNITKIIAVAALLLVVGALVLRREKYASV